MNVANLQREGLVMAVNNALVRKGLLSNRLHRQVTHA